MWFSDTPYESKRCPKAAVLRDPGILSALQHADRIGRLDAVQAARFDPRAIEAAGIVADARAYRVAKDRGG